MSSDNPETSAKVKDDVACESCVNCSRTEDCKKCSACESNSKCEQRICLLWIRRREEKQRPTVRFADDFERSPASGSGHGEQEGVKKRGRKQFVKNSANLPSVPTRTKHPRNQHNSHHVMEMSRKKSRELAAAEENRPRQCLGPDCILTARKNSKYCGDDCGKLVAKMRLIEILPKKTKEYFSSTTSGEKYANEAHARVRKDLDLLGDAEKKLVAFLDTMASYIKKISVVEPLKQEEKNDESGDMLMSCIVCGAPDIQMRRYAKHVNDCYERSERAVSYGTAEKSNTKFDIFCDVFDKKQKTYCRRLKSLCPEHSKKGIEGCLKVCGFPAKWDHYTALTISQMIEDPNTFGEECCREDTKCLNHHKWFKTLQGMIESEMANILFKKFEIMGDVQKMWSHKQWNNNVLCILSRKAPEQAATASGI